MTAPTFAVIFAFIAGTAYGWAAVKAKDEDPWWPALIPAAAALVCGSLLFL